MGRRDDAPPAAKVARSTPWAREGLRSLAGNIPAVPVLRPFRGLRYAAPAVTDYSAVICPPYDVISPAAREQLALRSPVNAVHVELPASYDEAGRLFAAWQANGTLRRDEREMLYVYEQRYRLADGVERTARGFMCRLRLEPAAADSGVHAHEHTMSAPKEDRFRLLSAVRANLSPVILLYEASPDLPATDLLSALTGGLPDEEALDDGGVRHQLWAGRCFSQPGGGVAAAGGQPVADDHRRWPPPLRDGPAFLRGSWRRGGRPRAGPAVRGRNRRVVRTWDPSHGQGARH